MNLTSLEVSLFLALIGVALWLYRFYKKYNKLDLDYNFLKREKRQVEEDKEALIKENSWQTLFIWLVQDGYRIAKPGFTNWLLKEERKEETIYISLKEVGEDIREVGSLRLCVKDGRNQLQQFTANRKEFAVIMFSQLLLLKKQTGIIEVNSNIKVGYLKTLLAAGGDKLLAGEQGVNKKDVFKSLSDFIY